MNQSPACSLEQARDNLGAFPRGSVRAAQFGVQQENSDEHLTSYHERRKRSRECGKKPVFRGEYSSGMTSSMTAPGSRVSAG